MNAMNILKKQAYRPCKTTADAKATRQNKEVLQIEANTAVSINYTQSNGRNQTANPLDPCEHI